MPKLHKTYDTVPQFRPIVSSIGTFNYNLASFLGNLVKNITPSEFSSSDTFSFLDDLKKHDIEGKFTVSFDICSLFTNIPLNETIDLAVDLILKKDPKLKITKHELKELFHFATSKTNVIFQGVIYDQIDGIAMGSPLAPTLANLFMGSNETKWLNEYKGQKPNFYRRYVDDIFATFETESDADSFFKYINDRHPNIKFTKEHNKDGNLPFLDILIDNTSKLKTSVYQKPTYTGLLTNFKSFVPYEYKTRLVNTLLDRTYKINSCWKGFDFDIKNLTNNLLRNLYPKRLIEKLIKKFLDKKLDKSQQNHNSEKEKLNEESRYIKLPFIGQFSKTTKNKINNLIKRFCKDNIKVNIVFTTCKIKSYFSTKDILPKCFLSGVIYKFVCQECNSCYVGRTHKYFNTRQSEHLDTDKTSAINKHLQNNNNCKLKNNKNSFSILDYAKTDYELALKEAMHIKWIKPNLNGQKKHEIIRLLI